MSSQISLTPSRRAATRFVGRVRRALLRALVEEQQKRGLTQTAIAKEIGVHRSVINRELRGLKDITLGRVAELANAMGRRAIIELPELSVAAGANHFLQTEPVTLSSPPCRKISGVQLFTDAVPQALSGSNRQVVTTRT